MQALRRKLTKCPAKSNSSNKDPSAAQTLGAAEMSTVGPPAGGDNIAIAGELSAPLATARRSRRLVRHSKRSSPTPPLNRRELFPCLGMTHILFIIFYHGLAH